MHLAAFRGSTAHVEAFIALGADVDAVGDLGGQADTAALLMARGAHADKHNEFGETPLQMAHVMGQEGIVTVLLSMGAIAILGADTDGTARQRWADFQSIQQENFEGCQFDE